MITNYGRHKLLEIFKYFDIMEVGLVDSSPNLINVMGSGGITWGIPEDGAVQSSGEYIKIRQTGVEMKRMRLKPSKSIKIDNQESNIMYDTFSDALNGLHSNLRGRIGHTRRYEYEFDYVLIPLYDTSLFHNSGVYTATFSGPEGIGPLDILNYIKTLTQDDDLPPWAPYMIIRVDEENIGTSYYVVKHIFAYLDFYNPLSSGTTISTSSIILDEDTMIYDIEDPSNPIKFDSPGVLRLKFKHRVI